MHSATHAAAAAVLWTAVSAMATLSASSASAQEVAPRAAAAVQPRFSPPVQPRHAPPPAERAPDAAAPTGASTPATARSDAPTDARRGRWQALGDTEVAGDGVAKGSQLRNIRCAGLACRVFQDSAGAWTLRAEAALPELAGQTLAVLLIDNASRQPLGEMRERGVFSDGRFWDQVDTWKLPAGSYTVAYRAQAPNRILAAVSFEVRRAPTVDGGATGGAGEGAAGGVEDARRQRLIEAARQRQRCLALAATNPDLRCELAP